MKIPLDESVPQKLRLFIGSPHEVATTAFQGWSGLKNGALLNAAELAGFELFITSDQEISYQQNLAGRRIAVLVLSINNWEIIKDNVAKIGEIIASSDLADVRFVQLDHRSR